MANVNCCTHLNTISSINKNNIDSSGDFVVPTEKFVEKLNNSEDPDFRFSYISCNEFNTIFKQVKRERQKKLDAKVWDKYICKKQAKENEKSIETNNCSSELSKMDGSSVNSDAAPRNIRNPNLHPTKKFVSENGNIIQTSQQIVPSHPSPQLPPTLSPPLSPSCRIARHKPFSDLPNQHCTTNDQENMLLLDNERQCNFGESNPKQDMPPLSANEQHHPEKVFENRVKSAPFLKDVKKQNNEKDVSKFNGVVAGLKKLEDLKGKIVLTIKGIQQSLEHNSYDVGQEEADILRCQKRNSAFAARFKRNYHYQLMCQMNEIKKLLGNDVLVKSKPNSVVQKFISSHQVVLQALQVIEKHLLASYSADESYIWLKEFTTSAYEQSELLADFESGFKENLENSNMVQTSCKELINRIEKVNHLKISDLIISKKKSLRKLKPSTIPQDNLWMYRTHRLTWKEKAADLAKLRTVRRKRKKCNIKEDGRLTDPSELKLLKMEVKQREGSDLRKHSRTLTEDQVRTMMEIIPEESETDVEDGAQNDLVDDIANKISTENTDEPVKAKLQELIDCRNATFMGNNNSNNNNNNNKRKDVDGVNFSKMESDTSNVKLVCLTCDREETSHSEPQTPLLKKMAKNSVSQYRKSFRAFKANSEWYNENVNSLVSSITCKLTDEILKDVVKEINVDHIIKKIIDLELKEI